MSYQRDTPFVGLVRIASVVFATVALWRASKWVGIVALAYPVTLLCLGLLLLWRERKRTRQEIARFSEPEFLKRKFDSIEDLISGKRKRK